MVELISSPGRLYVHTQMEKTIVDSILVFLWWWAEQRIDNTAGMDGVGMGLILHHKSLGKWVFSFLFTAGWTTFCFVPFSTNRCSWFGENFFRLISCIQALQTLPISANFNEFTKRVEIAFLFLCFYMRCVRVYASMLCSCHWLMVAEYPSLFQVNQKRLPSCFWILITSAGQSGSTKLRKRRR